MGSLRDSSPPGGDPHAAFVAGLFERCRRALLEYLVDLLSRREDAEDVVQETYLRLVNAKTLEHSEGRARAFMFKVATNLAYDRFRARRVRGVQSHDELGTLASDAPSPERVVTFEQGVEIVKRALLELTPRCRQVFLLRTAEDLDYDEIAQRLNVSRRTVEREMQAALELCQQRLRPENER